jgi:cytochrome c553
MRRRGKRAWRIEPRLVAALLIAGLAPAAALADSIDDSPFDVETRCGFCHGVDGNSVMARFPRLAGQDQDYLLKELRDYKAGRRQNDDNSMQTNVEEVSDGDLALAARYFAGLKLPPAPPAPKLTAQVILGATLYQHGRPATATSLKVPACATCHGDGAFMSYIVPHLGNQHAGYIEKQLEDFRSGRRGNDPKRVMETIAGRLSPAEIKAVARYLGSVADPDAPLPAAAAAAK